MGDQLANLLEIFKRVEKDGGQATLPVSTDAGKTTIKLELTSSPSKPAPSLPSSSASGGRRRRHRGPAKKEKAKVRAALHQATLASTTASVAAAPPDPPPPPPPPPPNPVTRVSNGMAGGADLIGKLCKVLVNTTYQGLAAALTAPSVFCSLPC